MILNRGPSGYYRARKTALVGMIPGVGWLSDDELPAVTPYPWQIDQADPAAERQARWERAATVIGVLGGLLGLAVTLRLIRA